MGIEPRNLWIPLLVVCIIAIGLLGSLFFPPFVVWGGVTMVLYGAILLGHPCHLLFFFWLWTATQPLVSQISNNFAVRYAEEALLVAFTAIFVMDFVRRRTDLRGISGVLKIATGLLGITMVSWLMNRSPIVSLINFLPTYLSPPIVFYVAYTRLDRRHWRYLVGALVGLTLVQFVLNIGWRFGINPLPNEWAGTANLADLAQGTFASCALVAYYMIVVIFLLLSIFRLNEKHRGWILMLLGVAAVQWYMTYTNHSYVFFVLLLPVYLLVSRASLRMRLGVVSMLLLGASIFAFLSTSDTYRSSRVGGQSQLAETFDRRNLEDRWEHFVNGPKIELINRIAIQNAVRDPYLWLQGNGPGNGLSAVGMTRSTEFAWKYLGEFVSNTALYKGNQMTSISGNFYSGILSIWSELGVVGYLLYLGFYIYLMQHVVLILIRKKYPDQFQLVLAEGFVMAMLLFLMCSFLSDVFYIKCFTGGLCIWAALVWDPVEAQGRTADDGGPRTKVVGQPVLDINRWKRRSLLK